MNKSKPKKLNKKFFCFVEPSLLRTLTKLMFNLIECRKQEEKTVDPLAYPFDDFVAVIDCAGTKILKLLFGENIIF